MTKQGVKLSVEEVVAIAAYLNPKNPRQSTLALLSVTEIVVLRRQLSVELQDRVVSGENADESTRSVGCQR
jgi:hypothetical protein